ncbi:DUF2782 domain-containing protein [Thiolapillus sp.]
MSSLLSAPANLMKMLLVLFLLLFSVASPAEDAASQLPPGADDGETLEPEVTIRQEGNRTVHEYRVDGRLYMVKIVPKVGPPYYLMDSNGDGEMDTREDDPNGVVLPQWILFRW